LRTRFEDRSRTGDRTARTGFRLMTRYDTQIAQHYRRS
jgi:hypothetical protein